MTRHILAGVALIVLSVSSASAQDERTHWGAAVDIVPHWKIGSSTKKAAKLIYEADEFDWHGAELRIGVVRGRELSGDWGVSFVRKAIAADATFTSSDGQGCDQTGFVGTPAIECRIAWSVYSADKPRSLTGVEVHKSIAFVTIKRRAQVGVTLAGGVAKFDGHLARDRYQSTYQADHINREPHAPLPPPIGEVTTVFLGRTEVPDYEFLQGNANITPLGEVEAWVGAIVGHGFKVRVHGGFNFPGTNSASVTLVYLFP
jgi:hypothetical protein